MKRLKTKTWPVAGVGALFLLAAIAAIMGYQRADPLISNGMGVYADPTGNYMVYSIQVVNASKTDIDIQSVTVNGGQTPDYVQLGIAYNSNSLIQYAEDKTDPSIKMIDLHDASIEPQLSPAKVQAIIFNKEKAKKPTPIHYGIVVRHLKEPLREVTIRYTYLGFTKVKRITHWFD